MKITPRPNRATLLLLSALIVSLLCTFSFWKTAAQTTPNISVPSGFKVENFYSGAPLANPLGLSFSPDGKVIVADGGPVIGDCATNDGAVYAIGMDGSVTTLVSGNNMEEPGGLAFGNGNGWGNNLYIADENAYYCFGAVFKLNDAGGSSPLTTLRTGVPWTPGQDGDPDGLAFGPGGDFGTDLYVCDPSSGGSGAGPGGIYRLNPSGAVTPFVFGLPLMNPLDMAFGHGDFGNYLYVADFNNAGDSGYVWRIDASGTITPFAGGDGSPFRKPSHIAFGKGGAFGTDLYVYDDRAGEIFRVDSSGNISVFASGITIRAYTGSMTFSSTGDALYFTNGQSIARLVQSEPPSCATAPAGLVAWLKADGDANDSAGGNNGALHNATFEAGKIGEAFRFGTGYVEVPDSPSLELQQISVAAWVRSQSAGSPGFYNYLLSMGSSNCDGYGAYQLQTDNTGGLRFGIGTFFGAQSPDAGPGIWDGNWHHVVGTYDGSFVRLFVDGSEVGSGTPLPNHQINYGALATKSLIIGDFNPSCGDFKFHGDLDDLQIYNHALTSAEIQGIHSADSTGLCPLPTPTPTPLPTPPFQITIDPGNYTGRYFLVNGGAHTEFRGAQTLSLMPGQYEIDDGGFVEVSPDKSTTFAFSIDATGQVTNINNAAAAYATGNTLHLRNATVNVVPGAYTGNYNLSDYYTVTDYVSGQHSFVLIPGLLERFDAGNGTFEPYFVTDGDGQINYIGSPDVFSANGNNLILKNTSITIDPQAYTSPYALSSHRPQSFNGLQTVVLIPAMRYGIDDGTGNFDLSFLIDANGNVTSVNNATAMSATGNRLSFNTVCAHVNPTTYTGGYRVGGVPYTGQLDINLIAGLRNQVDDGTNGEYFTPYADHVDPASINLTIAGQSYTFSFSSTCVPPPEPRAGLVAWYRADGNAVDSVGGHNGTTNDNLTFVPGKFGQAFHGDYVLVESIPDFSTPSFTLSMWVKSLTPNSPGVYNLIVSNHHGGCNGGDAAWEFNTTGSGGLVFSLGDGVNGVQSPDLGQSFWDGNWHNVVGTYDSSFLRLYVDGNQVGNGTPTPSSLYAQSYSKFLIGAYNVTEFYPNGVPACRYAYNGAVDDIKLYNRAVNSDEVRILAGLPADSIAPSTTASATPAANARGWNNSDVSISLSAVDNLDGSGVRQITYSASGAQNIPSTSVNEATAALTISAEGQTIVTYFATDKAGNSSTPQTLIVKIDKSAPSISCGAPDGQWHAGNVSIQCTASDGVSGLAQASNVSFTLSTSVADGVETSSATTNSYTVCDVAGNCATAGPIGGNRVDRRAPTIVINSPTNSLYLLNQLVAANYSCMDTSSGVAVCAGTVANGSNINTASIGAQTFTVTASDNTGNSATPQSISYTVGYGMTALYDQTKAAKSGSAVPIKIELVDVVGRNVSSSSIVVRAVSLAQVSTNASETVSDAGNSNPDNDFRFDPTLVMGGGYIFNLKTTGLPTGSYLLGFTAGSDPTVHYVQFQIRQ